MFRPDVRRMGRCCGAACEATLGLVASAALFAMMLLTFIDVVGRYFFSTPVTGGMEVVEVLLVLTVFAGLPLAAIKQGHIEIDVLAAWFPPALWALLGRLGQAIFAAALVFVSWLLWHRAQQLALDGEVTAILNIPVLAVAWSMVVLTLAAALLHLASALLPSPGLPAPPKPALGLDDDER